jgi:hypothetical protein
MFRKKILSALTIAVIASTAATVTTSAASAGGYGNNNYGGYSSGHHQKAPQYRDNWEAHVRWCYDQYKTYRDDDNSYRSYEGSREQCWSPYYRG